MSSAYSAIRLVDQFGTPIDVQNGVAVPVGQSGLVVAGSDGANLRFLKTDASGRSQVDLDRWFGSAVPTIGQKTAAQSIPVVLASDQPVVPTYPGSTTPTYEASSDMVVVLKTALATTIIATMFNPVGSGKIARLQRWTLTWGANAGNNDWKYYLNRITAENAVPGGTAITPEKNDTTDAASVILFRSKPTGAPTRAAFPLVVGAHIGGSTNNWAQTIERTRDGKPFTMRPGEGLELRAIIGAANLGSDFDASVSFEWTEATT